MCLRDHLLPSFGLHLETPETQGGDLTYQMSCTEQVRGPKSTFFKGVVQALSSRRSLETVVFDYLWPSERGFCLSLSLYINWPNTLTNSVTTKILTPYRRNKTLGLCEIYIGSNKAPVGFYCLILSSEFRVLFYGFCKERRCSELVKSRALGKATFLGQGSIFQSSEPMWALACFIPPSQLLLFLLGQAKQGGPHLQLTR